MHASAERLLRRPLPFAGGGTRYRIGVRPTDPSDWLEPAGDDAASQLIEKARVFDAHRGAVLGSRPGSLDACRELLELVRESAVGAPSIPVPAGCHPLEEAGRVVPEDFCLHLPDPFTGQLTLVAGCVCFPNRWSLTEKLGHPVTAIHVPVPRYEPQLARPVERFLAGLTEGRILERTNWSVVHSGALFSPLQTAERRPGWEGTSTDPWLRLERSTFRRLPLSGAVVFTIRTLTAPLSILDGDPPAATLLATAIAELPDEVARYKFGPPAAREALLARLTELGAAGA